MVTDEQYQEIVERIKSGTVDDLEMLCAKVDTSCDDLVHKIADWTADRLKRENISVEDFLSQYEDRIL